MSDDITIEIEQAALDTVPIFPLPGTVLLPHTLISLHIFEPRYRQMMAYCLDNHRVMAIAQLDEQGRPDRFGRPPIHSVAGLGYVRRSVRLPDGRYNLVLEGVARIDVSDEHPPETTFRRSRARLLEDLWPADLAAARSARSALWALCGRAFVEKDERELLENLHRLDAARLADAVAAAAVEEASDRQRVLEACDVLRRIELVSGVLGTRLLGFETQTAATTNPRWGIQPGEA